MNRGEPLRIAVLAAVPEELFPILDLKPVDDDAERGFASCGSLVTVEGYFLRALLARDELHVDVVTCDRGIGRPEQISLGEQHGALHRLPARRGTGMITGWIPRARSIRTYIRRLGVDLVHGFRTDYGYASMATVSGLPHLITIEGFVKDSPRTRRQNVMFGVGALAERRAIAHATNVMTISKHVADRISGTARGRLIPIPNMVGDLFFEAQRLQPGRKVVYVGRITEEKGLHNLLRAARLLDEQGVGEIEWVVIGGPAGPGSDAYLSHCKQAADQLRLSSVTFAGWLPNYQVAEVLRDATCAVFPYDAPYETFAIAVPEAMATAVPVIVSDSGPLPEHVDEGVSGFVVPPRDVSLLAAHIRMLLDDPSRSLSMGVAARRRAEAYRPSRVADKLLAAYRTIVLDA